MKFLDSAAVQKLFSDIGIIAIGVTLVIAVTFVFYRVVFKRNR